MISVAIAIYLPEGLFCIGAPQIVFRSPNFARARSWQVRNDHMHSYSAYEYSRL
jgi:hypothetical protein